MIPTKMKNLLLINMESNVVTPKQKELILKFKEYLKLHSSDLPGDGGSIALGFFISNGASIEEAHQLASLINQSHV